MGCRVVDNYISPILGLAYGFTEDERNKGLSREKALVFCCSCREMNLAKNGGGRVTGKQTHILVTVRSLEEEEKRQCQCGLFGFAV